MARIHVEQIANALSKKLGSAIDMSDYKSNKKPEQVKKAFLSRAVAALAVSHVAEIEATDVARSITDGSNDGGIDLVFFDEKKTTLYLAQSKWHSDGNGSIEKGDMLKFLEGVDKIITNDLEGFNTKIVNQAVLIKDILYNTDTKFCLVLAHTGKDKLSSEVERAINEYVRKNNDTSDLMSIHILQQADLYKAIAKGVSGKPISVEVQMTSWGQVREPFFAIYGQVCASDIAEWMETYGNSLFESNIRQFLGKSAVNEDIIGTLLNRPDDFWYFNNGITIVATRISKKPIGGRQTETGSFECNGFCIVNGAQTVGAIHAASVQNKNAVEKAMVPVRIISIETSPEKFSSEVTRATNTQNAIEKRNFVALDPIQEQLRQELLIEGVEYIYRAGTVQGKAGSQFDLAEATVALACASPELDLAVQAKREIGKLWEDITKNPYKKLFNKSVNGVQLWETVRKLRGIEENLKQKARQYEKRDALVCVHGNRFIQWAVLDELRVRSIIDLTAAIVVIPSLVNGISEKVIEVIRTDFSDSYPASLFKNLAKCRKLARKVRE